MQIETSLVNPIACIQISRNIVMKAVCVPLVYKSKFSDILTIFCICIHVWAGLEGIQRIQLKHADMFPHSEVHTYRERLQENQPEDQRTINIPSLNIFQLV